MKSLDLDADGSPERLSWTTGSADDAWLMLNRDHNSLITDGTELFTSFTPQPYTFQPNGSRHWARPLPFAIGTNYVLFLKRATESRTGVRTGNRLHVRWPRWLQFLQRREPGRRRHLDCRGNLRTLVSRCEACDLLLREQPCAYLTPTAPSSTRGNCETTCSLSVTPWGDTRPVSSVLLGTSHRTGPDSTETSVFNT